MLPALSGDRPQTRHASATAVIVFAYQRAASAVPYCAMEQSHREIIG